MNKPVHFDGVTMMYAPPPGRDDVGYLPVFYNGTCCVQAWELTDDDLAEIIRTKRVFVSQISNGIVFPTFIGSEKTVRSVVVDYGGVW